LGIAMAEREEIRMPEEPARLVQHGPIEVLITLSSSSGEARAVLQGRTSTQHLPANGTIVAVRPPLDAARMPPLRRSDTVCARFRRSGESLEATGVVSWVRPKAFLPSGLAVSLIGITFDGDAEATLLEVTAFLALPSLPPSSRRS
jgi:hypothetical protein